MSSLLASDKESALCRVERRAYGARRGAGRGRREAAGDGGARSMQGRARLLADWDQGRGRSAR
eukprot:scaffold58545_cov57-Phaeocystis_antarctica.AAC.1